MTDPPAAPPRLLLVTPAGWWRIPLQDPHARTRSIRALARRQFRSVDNQPALRSQTERQLVEAAEAAAERAGVEMYIATETVAGVPVSASLVISLLPALPAGTDGARGRGRLAAELRTDGAEVTLVDLPAGPAVRRRWTKRTSEATRLGATDDSVLVDFYLTVPGGSALVLLSFATPLLPIAEAMAEFFEAVASTARWDGCT